MARICILESARIDAAVLSCLIMTYTVQSY